ncbi:Ribokinase like superfamily protein, putative [Babesia bigemina]|uniref:Ribokinase like superfamily protein, putative n=1 Tax=Babesia bigemina TaxID=5866 RepID=A0A061D414_BABBI|nr:Ribokinase like superfamily protein, putative [Babesia bigemina]CDR93719.1 Ribokinase like superfamily protein, putative [Babesia bigemina]|eukprot:XP_012765905.1 Ribokinase like superfamily protein, putative [Babesia bigemina]
MNASYIFAAFVGIFAYAVQFAHCKRACGFEKIERGSKSILFVGHPMIDIYARADYSVVEQLNVAKGEPRLITPETFRQLGEMVNVEARNAGGSACNTARAFGYLGGKAAFFGLVGEDEEAEIFKKSLTDNNVEDLTRRIPDTFTSQLYSLVTPDKERTMYLMFGASHKLKSTDLDESIMERFDYYAVNGFMFADEEQVKFTHKMIDAALNRGKGVITLFANSFCIRRNGKYLKPIVEVSAYISGNLEEYSELYEMSDREELFRMFEKRTQGMFPQHKLVIITMGGEGAMLIYKGKRYHVPPCNVEVVDTTGAGDFFAASILYAALNGFSMKKGGKFAHALVGDIISRMGIQISEGVRAEIDELKDCLTL